MAHISKPKSPLRSLLFGVVVLFALAIGGWHIRSQALETGALAFGGRHQHAILKGVEPQAFAFWAAFFFWQMVVCMAVGFAALMLAWRIAKGNVPKV